jgi:hypothetical protein
MKKFTFFLFFSILGIGDSMGQSCRLQDSLALVDLYNATSGATTWMVRTNWLTVAPLSTWYGIKLNAQGCMDSLKLSNNRLNGKIPSSLGNLRTLRYLGLNGNLLTGSIPVRFQNLTLLTSLLISNNKIDTLPDLSALSQLTLFRADTNRLTFDDIVPNLPRNISYTQQDSLFRSRLYQPNAGVNFSIPLGVDSALTSNIYTWSKNGILYKTDSVNNSLKFNPLALQDAGTYKCVVTNRNALNLSLQTGNAVVQVICPPTVFDTLNIVSIVSCMDSFGYALPSGRKVLRSGIYLDILRSALGCDSIVKKYNLTLTSYYIFIVIEQEYAICQGDSIQINGRWVKTAGIFYKFDTLSNCSVRQYTIRVTVIRTMSLSTTFIPLISCKLGSITAVITGRSPFDHHSIEWNNGTLNQSTINALEAGTYTVTVTDLSGCQPPLIATRVLSAPVKLSAVIDKTDVSCRAQRDGTARVRVRGGVPPYQYLWSNGITIDTVSNLRAISYTVGITDSVGCHLYPPPTVIIDQRSDIPITIDTTICQGQRVRGFDTTGTFVLRVRDTSGCDTVFTIKLKVKLRDTISITTLSSPTSCLPNGGLQVNSIRGIGGCNIRWSNGSNSSEIRNLASGWYYVTVINPSSCNNPLKDSINLTARNVLTATINTTNATCYHNNNDGTASVTVLNGVQPYRYHWSNMAVGVNTTQPSITGLSANTYHVTITDSLGCQYPVDTGGLVTRPLEKFKTIDTTICDGNNFKGHNRTETFNYTSCDTTFTVNLRVISRPRITIDTIRQPSSCNDIGALKVNLLNTTAGYSYPISWRNNSTQAIVSTQNTASNLPSGTYTVSVTDASVCHEPLTASATLTAPPPLSATMTLTHVMCHGDNTGAATVTASGDVSVPPYTYAWSTVPIRTTPTITNLIAGSYTVTITDAQDCRAIKTVTITQPDIITDPHPAVTICEGATYSLPCGNIVTTNGIYPCNMTTVQGCPYIVTTHLSVIPKERININIRCDSVSADTNPRVAVDFINTSGCITRVVTNTYKSAYIVSTNWVCDPSAVLPDIKKFTIAWTGCRIDSVWEFKLAPSYRETKQEMVCDKSMVGIFTTYDALTYRGCDSFSKINKFLGPKIAPNVTAVEECSVQGSGLHYIRTQLVKDVGCQDIYTRDSLPIRKTIEASCARRPGIDTSIKKVDTCYIMFTTRSFLIPVNVSKRSASVMA